MAHPSPPKRSNNRLRFLGIGDQRRSSPQPTRPWRVYRVINEADSALPDQTPCYRTFPAPRCRRATPCRIRKWARSNIAGQLPDPIAQLRAGWVPPWRPSHLKSERWAKGIQNVDSGLAMLVYNGGPQTLYNFDSSRRHASRSCSTTTGRSEGHRRGPPSTYAGNRWLPDELRHRVKY